MTVPTELLLVLVPATALALWCGWRERAAAWPRLAAVMLLPPLLGALLVVYGETVALSTRWVWSACRLAPTIGLIHGYPLYSPIDSGPINGWLYGPVAALAWTPAALADSPQSALTIAAVINVLFLLVPLLAAGGGTVLRPGVPGGLAFIFGAAALLQVYPTWYMASALNADAVAVGLGAGSCLLLLRSRAQGRRLWLAALLGGLAAWSKPIEAALLPAQIGWLWFAQGRRIALHYTVTGALVCLGLTLLAGLFFPPTDLIFNLWTVPAGHAYPGGWTAVWTEAVDFGRYTALLWGPCLLIGFADRASAAPGAAHPTRGLGLLAAVALAVLPLGILAAIKIGGERNSMHSVYYLVVAATFTLGRTWPVSRPNAILAGALLVATTGVTLLAVRQVAGYPAQAALPGRCLSQEAWSYAREHPGTAYFPWDPLATLLAEGRVYHFEYGVLDRVYAGHPPTHARLRPDLPSAAEVVIYPRAEYPRLMVKEHLPEFSLVEATTDWLIHRRPPAVAPQPKAEP